MLDLLSPGMLGAGVGLIKNVLASRAKSRELKELRKISKNEDQRKAIAAFVSANSDKPYFGITVGMLAATICISILTCINVPDVPLRTIPPDAKPKTLDLYVFKYTWQSTQTIVVTTGGVAYDLLKVALFHLGLVLTGSRR
jgi:hypothetical protein